VLNVVGRSDFSPRDEYRSRFDSLSETIGLEDVVNARIKLSLRWNSQSQGDQHDY
jgi:hypothetical protein